MNKHYRAWFQDIKKMYEVLYFNLKDKWFAFQVDEIDDDYSDMDAADITESIGDNDKNGTEIFEGDIVKMDGYTFLVIKHPYILGAFALEGLDNGYTGVDSLLLKNRSYCNMLDAIEVIGNRFQNPELLEVKKRDR